MQLLDKDIARTRPIICHVDKPYAEYLHNIDSRISIKWSQRTYVGLAVNINGRLYVVPLTSQTTEKRMQRGKGRRNSQLTTFVKAGKTEIANLLHNNMFPVPDSLISKVDIDPNRDGYLLNEVRYLRKHWVEINNKSIELYQKRYDRESKKYDFLSSVCCDFRLLEKACEEYKKLSSVDHNQ